VRPFLVGFRSGSFIANDMSVSEADRARFFPRLIVFRLVLVTVFLINATVSKYGEYCITIEFPRSIILTAKLTWYIRHI
jgi:hypothetical protein